MRFLRRRIHWRRYHADSPPRLADLSHLITLAWFGTLVIAMSTAISKWGLLGVFAGLGIDVLLFLGWLAWGFLWYLPRIDSNIYEAWDR